MSEAFDPYYRWLGVSPKDQPPNHYRLLGIDLFESSPDVIEAAADRQMAHLRAFQMGKHAAESQRLLNELAAARVCLLNSAKKAAYDEQLRNTLASQRPQVEARREEAPAGLEFLEREHARTTSPAKTAPSSRTVLFATVASGAALVLIAGTWAVLSSGDHGSKEQSIASRPDTRQQGVAEQRPEGRKPDTAAKPHTPEPPAKAAPVAFASTSGQEAKPDAAPAGPSVPPRLPEPAALPKTPDAATVAKVKPAPKEAAADKPAHSPEQVAEKKVDPPTSEVQERLVQMIDEVYKTGQAKDRAAKGALAQKLLADGRKRQSNRAEQFVLLRRSGELACDAGAADLMLEAVDAIADAGFNIRPFEIKKRFLKRLMGETPSGVSELSDRCDACIQFAEEAAAEGAVAEASEVLRSAYDAVTEAKKRGQQALRAARATAARARSPAERAAGQNKIYEAESQLQTLDAALAALSECTKGIQKARRDREMIAAAQETLKASPDDADACLTVGRWQCFGKGDWDAGLKLLAKGSDESLRALAAADLASRPAMAKDRVARGDAWWDQAEKSEGRDRAAMRHRAARWYQEAMRDLAPGLEKSKVEERLAQAAQEPPGKSATSMARRHDYLRPDRIRQIRCLDWVNNTWNNDVTASFQCLKTRDGYRVSCNFPGGYEHRRIVFPDENVKTRKLVAEFTVEAGAYEAGILLRNGEPGGAATHRFQPGKRYRVELFIIDGAARCLVDGSPIEMYNSQGPGDVFGFAMNRVSSVVFHKLYFEAVRNQ